MALIVMCGVWRAKFEGKLGICAVKTYILLLALALAGTVSNTPDLIRKHDGLSLSTIPKVFRGTAMAIFIAAMCWSQV